MLLVGTKIDCFWERTNKQRDNIPTRLKTDEETCTFLTYNYEARKNNYTYRNLRVRNYFCQRNKWNVSENFIKEF